MSSVELIREFKNLSISELCRKADISRAAYYLLIRKGKGSLSVIEKLSKALEVPALSTIVLLDYLHESGAQVKDLTLPEIIPVPIRELIYKQHPIFRNKALSKYTIQSQQFQ